MTVGGTAEWNGWSGRRETDSKRFFQCVCTSEQDFYHSAEPSSAFVLLGYACDLGVRQNFGRVGAASGPVALRTQLSGLPVHHPMRVLDAGDRSPPQAGVLEEFQQSFAAEISDCRKKGAISVVLGGGHDLAFAHFSGLLPELQKSQRRVGCVNFDAHFDLRDREPTGPHSGSPYLQIFELSQEVGLSVSYLCAGVQPFANHSALFQRAQSFGVTTLFAEDMERAAEATHGRLQEFLDAVDVIYLSVCLDVFGQAFSPGVSAPQPFGLAPGVFVSFFDRVLASRKVIALDVAELCPIYDRDFQSARLGAQILVRGMQGLLCPS